MAQNMSLENKKKKVELLSVEELKSWIITYENKIAATKLLQEKSKTEGAYQSRLDGQNEWLKLHQDRLVELTPQEEKVEHTCEEPPVKKKKKSEKKSKKDKKTKKVKETEVIEGKKSKKTKSKKDKVKKKDKNKTKEKKKKTKKKGKNEK